MNYRDFVWHMASPETKDMGMFLSRCSELDTEFNVPTVLHATMGLCAESAEFEVGGDHDYMVHELGDVYFYWILACRVFGFDPGELTEGDVSFLSIETGALSEIVKKIIFQGKPVNKKEIREILANIRATWRIECEALNVDPNDVVDANIAKLTRRYPEGFSVERSNFRDE